MSDKDEGARRDGPVSAAFVFEVVSYKLARQ